MKRFVATAMLVFASAGGVQAVVDMQTVTVRNPGNTGENSGEGEPDGYGPDRICGAVDYVYKIGKFEVTAGQYTEFLNAVAVTDTYGLYNTNMWASSFGCKIRRTGGTGSYQYLLDPDGDGVLDADWVDRPVNFVSWGNAARFCNWMHNGQLTGSQDLTTTEDGSYYLDGATSYTALAAIVREPDATWVIPSEDEWYKSAYHQNDGVTGNYYDYPTRSDSSPASESCPGSDNSTNYAGAGWAVGPPYYRNTVGCYVDSASPYGTFDQGGNVYEWNEAVPFGLTRGIRGGAFSGNFVIDQYAAYRNRVHPTFAGYATGFRVANVSEQAQVPAVSEWGMAAMALLGLTAGTVVFVRRGVTMPRAPR